MFLLLLDFMVAHFCEKVRSFSAGFERTPEWSFVYKTARLTNHGILEFCSTLVYG